MDIDTFSLAGDFHSDKLLIICYAGRDELVFPVTQNSNLSAFSGHYGIHEAGMAFRSYRSATFQNFTFIF